MPVERRRREAVDMFISIVLAGVLLPAAVAGGIMLAGRRLRGVPENAADRRWTVPLAWALGYVAAHVAVWRWRFPPLESTDWLALLALAAGFFGVTGALRTPPAWSRRVRRIVLSAAIPVVLLRRLLAHRWEGVEGWLRVAALALALLLVWTALEALARRDRDGALPPALAIAAAACAAALLISGGALPAQLAGGLAAALGASWLAGLRGTPTRCDAGVIVCAAVLGALLINGAHFVELPAAAALLLAIAPLGAWTAQLPALAARSRVLRIGSALATTALLAAAAVATALAGPYGY